MALKVNPLKLNKLQLKTLTLLQGFTRVPEACEPMENGEIAIVNFPHAHGDHFHIGGVVVATKDTTGLANQAVWNALDRKGLARAVWPEKIILTKSGLDYETGMVEEIFHIAHH